MENKIKAEWKELKVARSKTGLESLVVIWHSFHQPIVKIKFENLLASGAKKKQNIKYSKKILLYWGSEKGGHWNLDRVPIFFVWTTWNEPAKTITIQILISSLKKLEDWFQYNYNYESYYHCLWGRLNHYCFHFTLNMFITTLTCMSSTSGYDFKPFYGPGATPIKHYNYEWISIINSPCHKTYSDASSKWVRTHSDTTYTWSPWRLAPTVAPWRPAQSLCRRLTSGGRKGEEMTSSSSIGHASY